MSVYRFMRTTAPVDRLVEMVADQERVDVTAVRVKTDPHPDALDDEVVLCTTDQLDHWPDA